MKFPTEILDDDMICFGDKCYTGKEWKELQKKLKKEHITDKHFKN